MVWILRCSCLIVLGQLGLISGHSYNLGKCPQFSPMKEFDWDKVRVQNAICIFPVNYVSYSSQMDLGMSLLKLQHPEDV